MWMSQFQSNSWRMGEIVSGCSDTLWIFASNLCFVWCFNTEMEDLETHAKILTVKPISDTRWECRIDNIKAVRYQTAAVYDVLVEVSENANDPNAKTEATGLAKQLKTLQFLVTLVIWYDLLFQMNMISKLMQSKDMQFDIALECIKSKKCNRVHKKTTENVFVSAQILARKLAQG